MHFTDLKHKWRMLYDLAGVTQLRIAETDIQILFMFNS
mgnify:CR=1 FL=1